MPPKRPSPARLWFKQGLQILRQPGNPCLHIMLIYKELFFYQQAVCLSIKTLRKQKTRKVKTLRA